MKKKVILLSLLIVIVVVCFIPVTQQKNVLIKGSFFNVYHVLADPAKWKQWRPDLREISSADSNKIAIKKDTNSFTIKDTDLELNLRLSDGSFDVNEQNGGKNFKYSYLVVPDKNLNKTLITVTQKDNVIKYLIRKLSTDPFSETHISDLKNFMETDSLLYGCKIIRERVPAVNLIVIDKKVLVKDEFTEAAKMLTTLQQYLKTHNVKQVQPLIAQFLLKGKDSALLKVGIFIDKQIDPEGDVAYNRMPKNGVFYLARFNGKFVNRQKVYLGLQQYFTDHLYQSALLPFEIYPDNKLPTSDTDRVNVQVVFASYF